MLAHWATPSNRDRVLGDWRPLPERSIEIARSAVRSQLPALLDSNQKIVAEALDLAASLGIREVESALRQSLATLETPADQRARALAALGRIGAEQLDKLVQPLLSDESPRLRAAAHQQLASYDAAAALKLLARPTRLPTRVERQQAMSTLAGMASPSVDNIMLDAINRLYFPEQVPADMRLDIQLAASSRKSQQVQSALKFYRQSRRGPLGAMIDCLEGGDIERGREIFLYRTEVSCVRCHKAAGRGGDVGPPLDRIGADKDLKYLLEAVLLPNAAIAKGFQSVSLIDHDGRVLSGVVRSENDTTIELISAEGRRLTIPKDQVDVRKEAKSPMPEDLAKRLSTSDIRDLVAFLASLKAAPQQP
jgi:quinoprotein glucose dehydrogenase